MRQPSIIDCAITRTQRQQAISHSNLNLPLQHKQKFLPRVLLNIML